ncbi:Adhesion G protein-coupled receptor L3 [Trichoplax sp. H2]|nr:Adhesion G protein-coupled receptor L3 [Trichoplax sp. H2]|eukprot:RDD47606.1 Adhesion G protein-coupled receptor L3 [Trichoplax sp. H2]
MDIILILCIALRVVIAQEECADGWTEISNRCFKSFSDVESFEDARIACQQFPSGDLAVDDTTAIHDNLKGILQFTGRYWIGLNDIAGNNQIDDYHWLATNESVINGEQFWLKGYPKRTSDRCVSARSLPSNKFDWINNNCSDACRYICQRPIGVVSSYSVSSDDSSSELHPSVAISTLSYDATISTATTTAINEMGVSNASINSNTYENSFISSSSSVSFVNNIITIPMSKSQLLTSGSSLDFIFSSTQSEGILESSYTITNDDNSDILTINMTNQAELTASTPSESHIYSGPISIASTSISDVEKVTNHHQRSSSNLIVYAIPSFISATNTTYNEKLAFTFSNFNDKLSLRSTSSSYNLTLIKQENPSILPVSEYRKTSDVYGYFPSRTSVDLLYYSDTLLSPAMQPSVYSSRFSSVTASPTLNPSPALNNGNSIASDFMTNDTVKEIQLANDQFIANIANGVNKSLSSVLKQIDHNDAVLARQINEANITTRLTLLTPNSELIAYKISASDETPIINLALSLSNESVAEVRIPRSVFRFSSQADTVTVVVRSYNIQESWTKTNTNENSSSVIISSILSCSMYPLQDKNFTLPVHFYLKIGSRKPHPPYRCVYWENTQWSQYGTDLIGYNSSTVHCITNHFTSFAVLMQGSKGLIGPHDTYLRYITYIGYSISLFALLMMIMILISSSPEYLVTELLKMLKRNYSKNSSLKIDSRKLHTVKNFIHLNLAIAMLICISGFLAGMNAASLPVICTIIAITLHFFYLASLMWMMMEAILLLHKISSIRKNMDPNLRWVYFIFGWGASFINTNVVTIEIFFIYFYKWLLAPPAIVVSVSASTGIDAYRNRDYCWIRNATTQMWFFVGPIIFIVAWNVVVVVTAIRSLFSIKAVVRKSEIQKFKVGIKAVTSLVFLFGISWIFGILYYATNHIVLAYLFTILNCPQGLLIFYFHCFQDREMQDYMRKKFKLGSMIFPTRSTGDCSRDIRLENTRSSRTAKISVRPISQDNACYECRDIGRCSFSHNKTAAIRKDSSNSVTTLLSTFDNPDVSANNMTDVVTHL